MYEMRVSLVFALIYFLTGITANATDCSSLGTPAVIFKKGADNTAGGILFQLWEIDNAPFLWSNEKPNSASYKDFVNQVQAATDTDPHNLLKRKYDLDPNGPDAHNLKLTFEDKIGRITPIRCIEALLLSYQSDRMDMVKTPTEFISILLRSPDQKKLKVYFYTINQPGIGSFGMLKNRIEADRELNTGWSLLTVLHNHNFFLNAKDVNGVTCPSIQDVEAFRVFRDSLGIEEAWITNGFHTIQINAAELDRLQD